MVGGLVYVHRSDGVVVVRRAPEFQGPSTGPQQAKQRRFAQAQRYVKRLKANPDQYAPYKLAAKIQRKRACDLAMSDFLNPPAVNDIDLSEYHGSPGQCIRVDATDAIEVQTVSVSLTHLDGLQIEQGAATFDESSSLWTYLTQTRVTAPETVMIRVTALDRPGNAVTKTVHYALLASP
jgi:hypothetical protein